MQYRLGQHLRRLAYQVQVRPGQPALFSSLTRGPVRRGSVCRRLFAVPRGRVCPRRRRGGRVRSGETQAIGGRSGEVGSFFRFWLETGGEDGVFGRRVHLRVVVGVGGRVRAGAGGGWGEVGEGDLLVFSGGY